MLKNVARPAGSQSVLTSKQGEKPAPLAQSDASATPEQSSFTLKRTEKSSHFRLRSVRFETGTRGTLHGGRAKSSVRDDLCRNAASVGLRFTTPQRHPVRPGSCDSNRTRRHSGARRAGGTASRLRVPDRVREAARGRGAGFGRIFGDPG